MADIITYPENGITYDADDAAGYLATRQSGVYSAEEDFAVTAVEGLSVSVSAGHAWVHPTRWLGRSIIMEQPTTVVLTEADAVRSRIDRLVLRYDAAAKKTSLVVLDGTPDSAEPVAPDISRTALVYDLCLAEIRRPAGSTEITAVDITDTRADETVCGVMRDGVTGIPAATLIQRLRDDIEALEKEAAAKQGWPVGSVYQSTDPTSPAALFGGTWEQIASERVLMGASDTHAAGSIAEAGLPDIEGSAELGYTDWDPKMALRKPTGAFSITKDSGTTSYPSVKSDTNSKVGIPTFAFTASSSNAIYGASDTVQPAAYYVYIWHRVA